MDCTRRFIHFIAVVILTIATRTQTTQASNPIKISGGEDHTLVLTENQVVWACGPNGDPIYFSYYGVLGTGSTDYSLIEETLTRVYGGAMNTTYLQDINDISAGWMHSLALDVNRFVWSWGWNDKGQLGDPEIDYATTPIRVHGLNNIGYLENIIAISAGRSGRHSLALDANNFVWGWGKNCLIL